MTKLRSEKVGFVGVGNMGTSILCAALTNHVITPSQIWVYDKITSRAKNFSKKYPVHIASSPRELFTKTDVVLLAIKPQNLKDFAAANKNCLSEKHCIISILAGTTTDKIRKLFGRNIAVVRVMPNLAATVGESMTVLCGQNKKWRHVAETLFSACGGIALLPENKLDVVTAVSGSGPAYFFHLMELMTEFGVRHGLTEKVAAKLAVQTGLGAALLAKRSNISCAELRQRVTSKKGTTEAALNLLKKKSFGKIFQQALAAAMKRSRILQKG